MDQSQTQSIETYYFPLSMEDEGEIRRMLAARAVFAPSFAPQDDEDVYDPLVYRRESFRHETKTIMLADRNIVTRWLAALSGKPASTEDRLAAAVMVFAQSANILVEPNLALYEAAVADGSQAANNELRLFRIADNLDIKHWTDLATGRIQKLFLSEIELPRIPDSSEEIDFGMRLKRWLRNYIILLKLAELELRGLHRLKRVTELARWMYDDFIIGGPGLIF